MLENVNNFLTEIIDEDIKNGLSERIHTRFPPEPNGYLHIGSICAMTTPTRSRRIPSM